MNRKMNTILENTMIASIPLLLLISYNSILYRAILYRTITNYRQPYAGCQILFVYDIYIKISCHVLHYSALLYVKKIYQKITILYKPTA